MAARFSDRQLRRRALKLKNANDQPGLVYDIPAGATLVDIINIYEHEGWPREKVWCAQCRGHRHKRGFTGLLTTGGRVNLGSKCGGEAFGEAWTKAVRRMEHQIRRQFELEQLDRLEPIFRPFVDAMFRWLPLLDKANARRNAFDHRLGELASRVREAANIYGGDLTVMRALDVRAAPGSRETVRAAQTVKVGRLEGAAFFGPINPVNAVHRAMAAMENARLPSDGTEGITTVALRSRRRAIEDAFSDLEAAAKMYRGAQEFYTAKNLKGIVDWTRRYQITGTPYVFTGVGIDLDDGRPGIRLPDQPLPDLCEVPFELMAEYRRADR